VKGTAAFSHISKIQNNISLEITQHEADTYFLENIELLGVREENFANVREGKFSNLLGKF
jgi:hypothetical protein